MFNHAILLSSATALALVWGGAALAQGIPPSGKLVSEMTTQYGNPSAHRGAPDPEIQRDITGPQPALPPPPGTPPEAAPGAIMAAEDGNAPGGVTPLKRDIFNSDDFYVDAELWTDPLYYRCASPAALERMWGAGGPTSVGDNFPETVAWGFCDRDVPREDIISPYGFTTAQEHYDALLAEVNARGGPTVVEQADLPDWSGVYNQFGFDSGRFTSTWYTVSNIQAATYASLFTDEYRKRFVQDMYHQSNTNAPQWPGAYCWPEGYARQWFDDYKWLNLSTDAMWILGRVAEGTLTNVHIGREFNMDGTVPRLGPDVRQWYGETVGFWDDEVLITWTSNVKGWFAHGYHEWSDEMQAIEFYTPMVSKETGEFTGLHHETILYDPLTFVEPVRIVQYWEKFDALNTGAVFDWRECLQTLYPIDGLQATTVPGEVINYQVPDWSNRPWADIWEQYWEEGMQRPTKDQQLSNEEALSGF